MLASSIPSWLVEKMQDYQKKFVTQTAQLLADLSFPSFQVLLHISSSALVIVKRLCQHWLNMFTGAAGFAKFNFKASLWGELCLALVLPMTHEPAIWLPTLFSLISPLSHAYMYMYCHWPTAIQLYYFVWQYK